MNSFRQMLMGLVKPRRGKDELLFEGSEIVTAARMVGDAPDLMIGGREPDATNGVSTITVKEVWGDVIGGNQMVDGKFHTDFASKYVTTNATATINDSTHTLTLKKTNQSAAYRVNINEDADFSVNHVFMFIGAVNPDSNVDAISVALAGNQFIYMNENQRSGEWNIVNKIVKTTSGGKVSLAYFADYKMKIGIGGGVICRDFSLLDLTLLFPTDQSFVTSLTRSDAIKVAHRLGFFVYDRDNTGAVTQLTSGTLAKMAEVVAKLGYQPKPKLWYGSWGRVNVLNGNTGKRKYTIDMSDLKKRTWAKVIEQLELQGITVPEFAQKPIEFGINEQIGVKWDEKGVTVSAWMVEFDGTEGWQTYWDNIVRVVGKVQAAMTYSAISIGYTAGTNDQLYQARLSDTKIFAVTNKTVAFNGCGMTVAQWKSHLASLKAAGTPLTVIYELSTPIRIEYGKDIFLEFSNIKPTDILALDDIEGKPMYDVSVETIDNKLRTTIAPNAQWVEEHHQLPVSVKSVIKGFGIK